MSVWKGNFNGNTCFSFSSAYHGHLTSIIDISPYKFDRIGDKKPWVHVASLPDGYRGKYRLSDADLHNVDKQRELAQAYANEVRDIVDKIKASGKHLCAFYMESLESCGGQVIPPPGYLERVLEWAFIKQFYTSNFCLQNCTLRWRPCRVR